MASARGSKDRAPVTAKIMGTSRYLIMIAVVGAYLAAAIVIIYGAILVISILIDIFIVHPQFSAGADRKLVLECIELIDTFLLGTAFYIVGFGLYELFIDIHNRTPNWLGVRSLEDLKARLLGVIIVVMSIYFLEQVIYWDGKRDILALGIAEALMIGAIVLTIKLQSQRESLNRPEEDTASHSGSETNE